MQRDTAIVIVVIVAVILLFGLMGGGMMGTGMMGGWGGYGFSPLWGIAMAVFWVLVIAGAVWFVVWLFREGRLSGTTPGPGGDNALEILRQRYAKGEITKEQFDRMRRDLEAQ